MDAAAGSARVEPAEGVPMSPREFGDAFKGFLAAVSAQADVGPLGVTLREHLGADPSTLPVVTEHFDTFEHANVQVAIDAYRAVPGQSFRAIGCVADHHGTIDLTALLSPGSLSSNPVRQGPVRYVNNRLPEGRTVACLFGSLLLIDHHGVPLAAYVGFVNAGFQSQVKVEVTGGALDTIQGFFSDLHAAMERGNVFRGYVFSLEPGERGFGPSEPHVRFLSRTGVDRDAVVLPDGVLERVERSTLVFSDHVGELLAGGRSLKRGVLLHGRPGTGKTHTIRYLCSRMRDRTVIITTGRGVGLIETAARMARGLAPAMVVVEDVDLIATDRSNPMMNSGPLLFELLNEMDGLRDDSDVIFLLTTNRPDLLEPALAQRPGRVDLAVELPLPDAFGRLRLLDLYARGLTLVGVDLAAVAERCAGASPAYIKEVLRRAALTAAEAGAGTTVHQAEMDAALAELEESGAIGHTLFGLGPDDG